jgi:phage gpG-like protein
MSKANNEARKIIRDMEKSSQAIKDMVTIMGVYAINHYKRSFTNGGFTDESLKRWQPRQRNRDNEGRAILVKTGRLKRSLVAIKMGAYKVRVQSNVPYALIHNEGGKIKKHGSYKKLYFDENNKLAKTRTARQRKAIHHGTISYVEKHTITMPQRQFVGYSGILAYKIEAALRAKIREIFK